LEFKINLFLAINQLKGVFAYLYMNQTKLILALAID